MFFPGTPITFGRNGSPESEQSCAALAAKCTSVRPTNSQNIPPKLRWLTLHSKCNIGSRTAFAPMTNRCEISPIESLLARVLSYGTWISTGTIAVGLTMAFTEHPSTATTDIIAMHVVGAGIALLIMLPIFRVTLMLAVFAR
jgi:hypothetical protein